MRPLGLFLLFIAVLFPIPWFLELTVKHDIEAVFSQYLGSVALICMGISQVLATRLKILEVIFGGLDRIYVQHKWLGITAMITLMLHDVIDSEMKNLGRETWLADIAEESGEIALYGLLILVFVTLVTQIPYGMWKKSHKFIGVFYALCAFHFLFILKPFALTDPLGIYLSSFCIVGIASYLYLLLIERFMRRDKPYQVAEIQSHGGVTELSLTPVQKGITHKPGQFAFLDLGGERHPFTVASAPNKTQTLRFFVKSLGNYTQDLPDRIKAGSPAKVSQGYGRFLFKRKSQTQVWIAGGIGITPFIAWIDSLEATSPQQIHLYHCIRGAFPFTSQLQEIVRQYPNVTLNIINSAIEPRLSASRLKADLKEQFSSASFSFCGPEAMRESLKEELASLGISKSRLRYEEFELRSGLNLAIFARIIMPVFRVFRRA